SKINETYNHVVGDEVLAEMASKLAEALRGKGIIARIGPDDFAMLMVCSNQRELAAEADRLESVVAALTIGSIPGGVSLPATIGLVWLGVPAPDLTLEVAMQRAAAALQDAKAGGGRGRRVLARTA
ncbi:MAG TPA: diguanylate cyclase, partial [Tepidisphaeraceae bacterium]|nr:diguanylate cyclase [Tepidisphaeraceae bacterium]